MDLLTLPRTAAAGALGLGTALRGARVFHPKGLAFHGTVVVDGGGDWGTRLLDEPGSYDVLVRVSRAAGLPDGFPDAIGLAIRFPSLGRDGSDLDVLVNTAGALPVLRHVFLPEPLGRTFTSVLPYRTGSGRRIMLGARRDGEGAWRLIAAPMVRGWSEWGRLTLSGPLPLQEAEQLRFMPTIGATDLQPVALFRRLRHRAYERSQAER